MLSCGYETSDEEKAGSDSDGSPQEDSEDSEELSAWEKELAVKALDKRLRKLSYLRTNHAIHKYFRQYARAETSDGSKAVTPAQVVQMAPEVARYLEVPDAAFSQVYQICQRFDFDGGGALNKKQCTAMFRTILRQKRKEWGGTKLAGDVPYRGLREAGYTVDRELGRGGQGVMYLCTFGDSERYCVKFYSKEDGDQDELETIMTEYALMTELSHPNIAKTYEVFQDSKFFYLVNEPYFGGDLTKVAKRAHDQSVWMGENWFRGIFRQCLEGLQFLHSQAVMHCDIKEENIMVVASDLEYPRIVLIDFGLAIAFSSAPDGCAGTPGYIPPETWTTSWWYPRGDIFSLGITIFQMMIGQVPNDDVLGILQTEGEREEDKAAGLALQLPWKRFPSSMRELEELVAGMVHRDMTCRPSATAALNHAWFTTSDNDEGLPAETISALVGVWLRNRGRVLWGCFALVAVWGVGSLLKSSEALMQYQTAKTALTGAHRSNIGRMAVAGLLLIMDICIVTQDLDFPHFENSVELKMLGTNIAFEGCFINYIQVVVSMLLDLNCLYTMGWYTPLDYGQYVYSDSDHICSLGGENVNATIERWTSLDADYRKSWYDCGVPMSACQKMPFPQPDSSACEAPDHPLQCRYYTDVKSRTALAVLPFALGLCLFCSLFRLAGRSAENLCRRVVISNAFAAKKSQDARSVELTEVVVASYESRPSMQKDLQAEVAMTFFQENVLEEVPEGGQAADRVIVVTAVGVKVFELSDNPRSPDEGLDGAWMQPHVFCRSFRRWLRKASLQGCPRPAVSPADSAADASSMAREPALADVPHACVKDLKGMLRNLGYVRRDVPIVSLELLWQGRLLPDETLLRSLGPDPVLYLLYDRWALRRKRLAVWRARTA